jgi:hypothetical protein
VSALALLCASRGGTTNERKARSEASFVVESWVERRELARGFANAAVVPGKIDAAWTTALDTPPLEASAALDKVDVSVVETLTGIKSDQDAVQGLLAKATERKDKVSPAVYARVAQDYEGRLATLEERARPLREQARAQLVDLMKLHGQIKSDWEAAQLAQQEIEFRHEVGELSPNDFEPRRKTAVAAVEERQRTFERAETLRERFQGVLPPETASAPAPAPAPVATTPAASAPPAAPSVASAAVLDRTESMPNPTMPPTKGPVAAPPREAAAAATPPTGEIGAIAAPKARLVEENPGGVMGRTIVLGAVTAIGRTPDNQIAADIRELSRHHARIEQRPDGSFVLMDLQSGNGTWVNGQRITEHRLGPGDRIQVGTLRFVYQAG